MLCLVYKEDTPTIVIQLEQAIKLDDAIAARAAIHRLKGMAATLYATELVDLLQKCEWTSSHGDLELTRNSLSTVRAAVETVLTEI